MDSKVQAGPHAGRRHFRYTFENVEFNEATNTLLVDGVKQEVERLPLLLLAVLLRNKDRPVKKDDLIAEIWRRATSDAVLNNAKSKLSTALGAPAKERIETVPTFGYLFRGPVQEEIVEPVGPFVPDLQVGLPVPHRGEFQLERCLGRGGRDNVWLARDGRLGLTSVFKFAFDSKGLTALKRESELLLELRTALGERHGFVKVLKENFDKAPYFLEFEYAGVDLIEWSTKDAALKTLDKAGRVALFLQIAEVVAPMHSIDALHNDLKPANILVTGEPGKWEIRLTEFSYCELLNPERLRQLGVTVSELAVTPTEAPDPEADSFQYLAPELRNGRRSDMKADVYALGMLLWQMLVGDFSRPMVSDWQDEIEDELLREDIVAATQWNPDARLNSAAELVARLSTLALRHEGLVQRRQQEANLKRVEAERTAERAAERARRPWRIGLFAVLSVGLIVTGWFWLRANEAKRQAQAEARRAEAISDFMTKDVLRSADISRAGSTGSITLNDVLRRASALAGARFVDQPMTEALVRCQLGDTLTRGIATTAAIAEYRAAIGKMQKLESAPMSALLRCRFGLALALAYDDRGKEAQAELDAAKRDAGALLNRPVDELVLAAMTAEHEVLIAKGHADQALPLAQKLVKATDDWAGGDLTDRYEARQRLAEDHLLIGDEPSASKVLETLSKPPFSVEGVGAVTHARAEIVRGRAIEARGDLDGAVKVFRDARKVLLAGLGPMAYHVGLVDYETATALEEQGGHEKEVWQLLESAQAIFTETVGPEHGNTLSIAMNLGLKAVDGGHPDDALQRFDAVRPLLVTKKMTTIGLDFHRARALVDLNRAPEALDILDKLDVKDVVYQHRGYGEATQAKIRWQYMAVHGLALIGIDKREAGKAELEKAVKELHALGAVENFVRPYEQRLRRL